MPAGALTVATYPHEPVRLACRRCGRAGSYRRKTLAEMFGPGASMPDVLVALAACSRQGNYSDPCAAVYLDLGATPPTS